MSLLRIYDDLYEKAVSDFQEGNEQFDLLIDDPSDRRRGLTLIFRPCRKVIIAVNGMLDDFRKIEPDQYFYGAEDIHNLSFPVMNDLMRKGSILIHTLN